MKRFFAAVMIAAMLISVFTACTTNGNDETTPAQTNTGTTAKPTVINDAGDSRKEDTSHVGQLCFIHELKGFAPTSARLNGDKVEKSNDLPFSTDGIRGDFLPGECITVFMEGSFIEGAFENSFATLVPHSASKNYNGATDESVSAVKLAAGKLETPDDDCRVGSVTVPKQTEPGIYDLLISYRGNIACCIVINVSAE